MSTQGPSSAVRGDAGRWRSNRAEQRFRKLESAVWSAAEGATPTSIDVVTSYGLTRAYRWPGGGAPVVLLHGGGMTSVVWAPYANALRGHDVYAVDIMGDVGRSEPRQRLGSACDMAAWLNETLEQLGLDEAHLVGHSLGGFVALSTAAYRPGRVASLVLLDPLGIAPLNLFRFMVWGLPVLLGSLAPGAIRRWLARRLRNPLLENKRASRLILHGMARHSPGYPLFHPLADDLLRSIGAHVELLVASESEPFDEKALASRARELLPRVTIERVSGAGHALPVSHLDACVAAIERALS